jgi:hypothetical protein
MVPEFDATLTPAEFASLREVSKGHMQRLIPDAHKAKLLRLGLIRQKLGGLVQTNIGYLRVAKRQSGQPYPHWRSGQPYPHHGHQTTQAPP